MSATIKTWYDFVLQQMAAESYLDNWSTLRPEAQMDRLNLGSNNYLIPANQPTTGILDGATRMTATQAEDFLTRYTVKSHLPNTASGTKGGTKGTGRNKRYRSRFLSSELR